MRRSEFANLEPIILEIEGEEVAFPDYQKIAVAYANAVIAKTQPAGKLHIAACVRYLKMLALADDEKNDFYFSVSHVIDYCAFWEKLQHIEEGNWRFTQADASLIMEPWQIWVESAIQGFRWHGTSERVVSRSYEEVPRKSAKSEKMGVAGLFDLCCSGQQSPQIVIGASTRDQADRVFNPIAMMANKEDELRNDYNLRVTSDYVKCLNNDGEIFKLSSKGERQDGLNPSLSIMEEMHAQPESVYRVVRSAHGARPNALMRIITTAGYHASGVGWSLRLEAEQILTGRNEDYSFFALICTIDAEDYCDEESGEVNVTKLLTDQSLMMKANPMWGISIDPRKIMEQANEARRSPDKRGEFFRTRYNIWNNAGHSLIDPMQWQACRVPNLGLDRFVGEKCWMGVDLASESDMCAIGIVFEMPGDILAVFARYFIPRHSPTFSDPDMFTTMMAWEQDGHLIVTEGGMADYDRIETELDVLCEVFKVQSIAFDPYQSNQTMYRLWQKGLPVGKYPNSAATMTMPTDNILSRISGKKIAHDGHPILTWNASNVHGERRGNGSIMPRKEAPNSPRKIDGFVAIIFGNGVRMNPAGLRQEKTEQMTRSPYETRGIIGYKETADGN